MEKLKLDNGIRSFRLGSGVLRFNPTDPNLYARFLDAPVQIQALQQKLTADASAEGAEGIALLQALDAGVKEILTGIFGAENDFAAMLGGVNVMALGSNGKRVITNLLDALQPVLAQGAKDCAKAQAQQL